MPIYEYRCPNGHTFELFQRMSDPQPSECQICGESPLEKVLYPAALHFKGSGFYKTDSRTRSTAAKSDAKSSDGKSESSPSEKSDSKSDSKSESKSSEKKSDSPSTKSPSDAKSA